MTRWTRVTAHVALGLTASTDRGLEVAPDVRAGTEGVQRGRVQQ